MAGLPTIERTPDGRRLVVSRVVAADPDAVWDVLTDTEQWSVWGPSVTAVKCEERTISAGTTGEVQVLGGPWISFVVTSCRDYRWTWRVADIPATGHFVQQVVDGARVGFEIPLLAAGYAPVCQRALDRIEELVTGA